MIPSIMHPLRCVRPLAIAAATTLAGLASAQAGAQLSLATVLREGPALIAPLPQVDWLPDGHAASVVITGDDRVARMHRLVDGAPAEDVLCTANELYAALEARFSREQLVELCATVGLSAIVNRFHATFRTDVDDDTAASAGDVAFCPIGR